jgi:hypothetical protein
VEKLLTPAFLSLSQQTGVVTEVAKILPARLLLLQMQKKMYQRYHYSYWGARVIGVEATGVAATEAAANGEAVSGALSMLVAVIGAATAE